MKVRQVIFWVVVVFAFALLLLSAVEQQASIDRLEEKLETYDNTLLS